MCASFTLRKSRAQLMAELPLAFDPRLAAVTYAPPADLFPGIEGHIITAEGIDPMLTTAGWGLLPRDTDIARLNERRKKCFNARTETVHRMPPFAEPWEDRRRCVVPVESFVEWEGKPGSKVKLAVGDPGKKLLMLAGLWDATDSFSLPGFRTFTILTCEPNEFLRPFIKDKERVRMPVILQDWYSYLDPETPPEEAQAMCVPYQGNLAVERIQPRGAPQSQ